MANFSKRLILREINVTTFLLKIIILVAFTGNWLVYLGFLPQEITWLQDIIPSFLFLHVCMMKKRRCHFYHINIVLFILIAVFISWAMNGTDTLKSVLFVRFLLRYYPLYIALANANLSEFEIKKIVKFVWIITAIQLPVAITKAFIYGQGETAIGTYAFHGGGLSTLIPLAVISYVFPAIVFNKLKIKYLFIFLGAAIFAIVGGKRGFIFFLPIAILPGLLYIWTRSGRIITYTLTTVISFIIVAGLALKFIPTLNPENTIGGSINPSHAIQYAIKYETRKTYTTGMKRMSEGRYIAPVVIYRWLKNKGSFSLLFGYGPGSFMQTFTDNNSNNLIRKRLSILYGTSGYFLNVLQIGFIGATLYILLFIQIMRDALKVGKQSTSLYWQIFSFGTVGFSLVFIVLETTYGQYIGDDLTLVILFIFAGFVTLQKKSTCKQNQSTNYTEKHHSLNLSPKFPHFVFKKRNH